MGRTRVSGVYGVALLGLLGLVNLGTSSSNTTTSAPTAAQWRAMGHMYSANGTLRSGCRKHYYNYHVYPPSSDWGLETFLYGPKGKRLGSDVILSGADSTAGKKYFTICKSNTTTGTFTIKGKLTYDDYPTQRSGWITSRTFKLTKP